jgi:hypothetical protein
MVVVGGTVEVGEVAEVDVVAEGVVVEELAGTLEVEEDVLALLLQALSTSPDTATVSTTIPM